MPRAARKKSDESMYHIMCRSISEVNLFQCDEDKDYYLSLLKRYIKKYHCRIYAYCLMGNHVHIYIDPCGFDISSFMRSLNCAYVSYFNRKYKRRGPLFQGRFASKIVHNDTYSLTLSSYIHNNPKDMPGYENREEEYRYSSYGVYTGYRKDVDGIVDTDYILKLFAKDKRTAQQKYRLFTESMRDTGIIQEVDEEIMRAYTENEYRSEKSYIVRDRAPDKLRKKVGKSLGEPYPETVWRKYSRQASSFRAFVVYVMRILCGYSYKRICEYIGNMSLSGISRLSNEGFRLLNEHRLYRDAFNVLIQTG